MKVRRSDAPSLFRFADVLCNPTAVCYICIMEKKIIITAELVDALKDKALKGDAEALKTLDALRRGQEEAQLRKELFGV